MEFKGVMGGIYRVTEWIMRLSVTNVLWILCSLPVFVISFLGLINQSPGSFVASLPIAAILTPFTLFPATAAVFTVARKWLTGEEDVPLFKTFFRGFKENYVQSMVGGLIFVLVFVIIAVNYYFYARQGNNLSLLAIVFIAFAAIAFMAVFNFFSIMAHLHMKVLTIVKNSFLITIGNPINSVVMGICNGVIIYVSLFKFTFLVPFFMGSLLAITSFWLFHRSFEALQMKRQVMEEKEAEASQERLEERQETDEAEADKAERKEESAAKADLHKMDDNEHNRG